jgi:4-amino-4-deoxy-L-arabinose transferase-like glycosyltransferase
VYLVVGHHPIAVKFLQGFLDILTAFLIYMLLVTRSPRAAVVGALVWCVFPPAVLYANFLMSETIFTFLLMLAITLLVRNTRARTGMLLPLGITIGLLALMKPGAALILLVPVVLCRKLQLSWRTVALIIVSAIVVIAPWVIRNRVTFGEFALSSNGGINLLIGNHPNATGAYNLTFDPLIMSGASSEFEAEERASHYAWDFIATNPGTFAVNSVKKLAHFLESEGGILVWVFHPHPESPSTRFGAKYREIPLALSLLANIPYALILLAGLLGFIASERNVMWWTALLVGMIWLSIHILFFGGSRFHFPLMAVATVYAAFALVRPLSTFKGLAPFQRVLWLFLTGLLLALWSYEGFMVFNA